LNKVLKDIVNRWKLLSGHKVLYTPGWDCHGLPIELKALGALRESTKGVGGDELTPQSPQSIRAAARSLAESAIEEQAKDFKRWGVLGDWDARKERTRGDGVYVTMDSYYEATQLRVFGTLVASGAVKRALRPVWWSPSSTTALAEAELEYVETHTSKSVWVVFPFNPPPVHQHQLSPLKRLLGELHEKALREGSGSEGMNPLPPGLSALVWTTTPWTLPSNVALAIHPDLEYCVVSVEGHPSVLLLLASSCMEVATRAATGAHMQRGSAAGGLSISSNTPLVRFLGRDLLGATFLNPLQPLRTSLCIKGAHVVGGSGSGVVHTSPGHGVEDFASVLEWNSTNSSDPLPVPCPVDAKGCYSEEVSELLRGGEVTLGKNLVGLPVLGEGGDCVRKALRDSGTLFAEQTIQHRYPYDSRSRSPVIVRATAQWFIETAGLWDASEKAVDGITFYPATGEQRLRASLAGRTSWCISRQRAWGVPIPAFFNSVTGEALLSLDTVDFCAQAVEKWGSDVWWSQGSNSGGGSSSGDTSDAVSTRDPLLPPQYAAQAKAEGFSWVRGRDTLDVWFDSGVSWAAASSATEKNACESSGPLSQTSFSSLSPSDLVIEGSDQHRGWFQSSLLTRLATGARDAPFRACATHGFVLDEKGRKMSKSLGNVVAPGSVIDGRGGGVGGEKKKEKGKAGGNSNDNTDKNSGEKNGGKEHRGGAEVGIGVDGLRFWVASVDFSKDVSIGPTVLSRTTEALKKARNTARFLLGVIHGFSPVVTQTQVSGAFWYDVGGCKLARAWGAPSPWTTLAHASASPTPQSANNSNFPCVSSLRAFDAAYLGKLQSIEASIRASYDTLSFEKGVYTLNSWIARDVSAVWCDAVKDRLYQENETSVGRWEAQALCWETLRVLSKALAPIAPFTAQHIYVSSANGLRLDDPKSSPQDPSGPPPQTTIFHAPWIPLPQSLSKSTRAGIPLDILWEYLCSLRSSVQGVIEKCRGEGGVGSAAEVRVTLYLPHSKASRGAEGVCEGDADQVLLKCLAVLGIEEEVGAERKVYGGERDLGGGSRSCLEAEELFGVSHVQVEFGWGGIKERDEKDSRTWWGEGSFSPVFNTSKGFAQQLQKPSHALFKIKVQKAGGVEDKCCRCWKYRQEVRENKNALCKRCAKVVEDPL